MSGIIRHVCRRPDLLITVNNYILFIIKKGIYFFNLILISLGRNIGPDSS